MLGNVFYHSLKRKYVIMFGSLFNDIVVRRFDKTNNVIQNIDVPIAYAPKEKWVVMSSENQNKPIAITLPRLSFYCPNFNYDPSGRKTSSLNKIVGVSDKANEFNTTYNQIPWKLDFELYVIAKNHDDASQIIEQIIPYFQPTFTPSVELLPSIGRTWDIPVRLKGISSQEAFDGAFDKRRVIIYTLAFEIDAWFFGPIQKQGVIKRVQTEFILPPNLTKTEKIVNTPGLTSDGKPTSDPNETISYNEITAEDDYGFIEEFYHFEDGKDTTGND